MEVWKCAYLDWTEVRAPSPSKVPALDSWCLRSIGYRSCFPAMLYSWEWEIGLIQRLILSETATILSAYKKRILDPYELQVIPARSESFSYFLRNSETLATDERLDFRWVKNSKTIASITFALSEDLD